MDSRRAILAPSLAGKSVLARKGKVLDGDVILSLHWGWPRKDKLPTVPGKHWWQNPFMKDTVTETCARIHFQLAILETIYYPLIEVVSGEESWKEVYQLDKLLPIAWATVHMRVKPTCSAVVWLPGKDREDSAQILFERTKIVRIGHGSKPRGGDFESELRHVDHFLAYAKRYHLQVVYGRDAWDDLPSFDINLLGHKVYDVPKKSGPSK